MPETPVSICNLALSRIGTRSTIASLTEDSNEARELKLHYDTTRRQVLRAAHWNFARQHVVMTLIKARRGTPENPNTGNPNMPWDWNTEPPPPWLYSYALPPFCVAMRYIQPRTTASTVYPPIFGSTTTHSYPDEYVGPLVKFEISQDLVNPSAFGTVVLTNQSQAIGCYTFDVTDTTRFDEGFITAFAAGLAVNCCISLTGDLKQFDALVKMANAILINARTASANESLNVNDVMPDWYRIRGLGPAVGTGPWMAEYGPLFGGVH